MKTEAAILVEQRKPLVIDEIEMPVLDFGQILVEVRTSRICGSQVGEVDGIKGPDRYLPHLLGHEAGAVVLEVGPGVSRVKPDDRVVLHWRPGVGIESRPPVYRWNGERLNAGWVTTFNRYAVVSENRVTAVPRDTSFDLCALLADTLTTGFGVMNNDARLHIGESVVVVGCGGIGLGCVLGARLAGGHPVIAVDLFDHKLELARRFGASHAINARETDWQVLAEEILLGKADVVVDGTGNPEVIDKALALTSAQGRCVGVGVMRHDLQISLNTLQFHFGKRFVGSHGGESRPAEDIPRFVRMIHDGVFDPSGFISHRVRLEDVNEAMDRMRAGEVVHCLIDF